MKANFASKFTFGVDLQGNYSFSFPMAVASYHCIRSGKVELGVRYFQPILWSCTHQPEVGCVSVIVGLQSKIRIRYKQVKDLRSQILQVNSTEPNVIYCFSPMLVPFLLTS